MNEIRENAKLFIVFDAPSYDDLEEGKLLSGNAGKLLLYTLERYGLGRDDCSIACLWEGKIPGGKFEGLLGNKQLYSSIGELERTIERTNPNVVLLLGGNALKYLGGKSGISKWRGSIFTKAGLKYTSTLAPRDVIKSPVNGPVFDGDVSRAIREAAYPEHRQIERTINLPLGGLVASDYYEKILGHTVVSCDIESVRNSNKILCISFAVSPTESYVFNWEDIAERGYAEALLSNPAIGKVFHFGGYYDINQLRDNGAITNNYYGDTSIAQHILNPELPNGLDFLTSIYTDMSYYKQEGRGEIPDNIKAWSDKTERKGLFVYNGKDTLVTYEIWQKQMAELEEYDLTWLYDQEMELAKVAMEISANGMLVDTELRDRMAVSCVHRWNNYQLLLGAICGRDINVRSTPAIRKLLYDQFKLPPRRNKKGNLDTSEDAIVSLMSVCADKVNTLKTAEAKAQWQLKLNALQIMLEIRGLRQLTASYLMFDLSPDGRVRSSYNAAATETGRWAASKYVDGTGVNSQTFPRGSVEISENADKTKEIEHILKSLYEEETKAEAELELELVE